MVVVCSDSAHHVLQLGDFRHVTACLAELFGAYPLVFLNIVDESPPGIQSAQLVSSFEKASRITLEAVVQESPDLYAKLLDVVM